MTNTPRALSFRAASATDVPFLLELRRQTMSEYLRRSGIEPTEEERHERVNAQFECAQIVLLSDVPVGLLKVAKDGTSWHLIQIQISPEHQGTGLGSEIMKKLVDDARLARAAVNLSVLKANPARTLYERFGFRIVSESDHSYEMRRDP